MKMEHTEKSLVLLRIYGSVKTYMNPNTAISSSIETNVLKLISAVENPFTQNCGSSTEIHQPLICWINQHARSLVGLNSRASERFGSEI